MSVRAAQLEMLQSLLFPSSRGGVRPSADPQNASANHHFDLSNDISIMMGRVVDAIPYVRCYKVQLERLQTTLLCNEGTMTGLQPYGARQLSNYTIGSLVVVLWHKQLHYGTILCAVPDFQIEGVLGTSDMINQGSNVGLRVDLVNSFPMLAMPHNGGISDFSAHRPMDSLCVGEWGAVAETGLAIFMDAFMAFLRVDEETGLFAFYHDQLLRVAGHNLQQRSSGHESEYFDDESELFLATGHSSYTWEGKGVAVPGVESYREQTVDVAQGTEPWLSRYEPLYDDQQPIRRLEEYHGYLGQITSRFVALPGTSPNINRYSNSTARTGVFSEHISQAGHYSLRAAKGVTISKTTLIPNPKLIRRPEDPDGDDTANYRASGVGANGKEHKIFGEIPLKSGSDATQEGLIRAAAVMDWVAYTFNWQALHPFHYHALDWYLPEETALPLAATAALATPDFTALAADQYLAPQTFTSLTVDHRHSAKYYAGETLFHFTDDGGFVLADAYGFEIRTSQGSGFISLPGDLWIQSGKNINLWAGHDAIVKAKNSVDITASTCDVRICGNHNVMALSGVDGCGGIILESRADCAAYDFDGVVGEDVATTGIVMIARKSPIAALGNHILLSTNCRKYTTEMHTDMGSPDPSIGEFEGGPIVIDAGRGDTVMYANQLHRHIGKAMLDVFVDSGGNYRVNEWWYDRAMISSALDVAERLAVNECILASSDIQTLGNFATPNGGNLAQLNNAGAITATMTQITDRKTALETYAEAAKHDGRDLIESNDISLAEFSFRTPTQYRTTSLSLYESRWQQFARLSGQSLATWTETSSTQLDKSSPIDETYPHPGREPWTGGTGGSNKAFWTVDLQLYDPADNEKSVRGGASNDYESAEHEKPVASILASAYSIIGS